MHSKCTYIFVNRVESIIHGLPVFCVDHVHGQSGRSQLGLPGQCQCEHIRHGQRPHCLAFCLHDGQNSNLHINVTSMFLFHSLFLIRSLSLCLFVAGIWRVPGESQLHAQLAVLAQVGQYLQIWTRCKEDAKKIQKVLIN